MKFLVDAQLPVRLARFLKTSGYGFIAIALAVIGSKISYLIQ